MIDRSATLPAILLVGTGHWSNPGRDFKSVEFDDMRARERQRQIAECLNQLADFAPTSIALEIMERDMVQTCDDYRNSRAGTFELTANERHQLGFRLAAKCELDLVHGIDWHDLEHSIGWEDAIDFAKTHDQHDLIGFYTGIEQETEADKAAERQRLGAMSVREQLLSTNATSELSGSHAIYMDLVLAGIRDNYIGADVILRWYERNMKMYVNIARLATSAEDRILVVVGGGHLPLLRHFIEGSGRFTLEQLEPYLSPA